MKNTDSVFERRGGRKCFEASILIPFGWFSYCEERVGER